MHLNRPAPLKRSPLARLLPLWVVLTLMVSAVPARAQIQIILDAPGSGATVTGEFPVSADVNSTYVVQGVTAKVADRETALTYTNNRWRGTLSAAGLPRGTYDLTITATDQRGNPGSATFPILVDHLPTITSPSPTPGAVVTGDASFRLTAICTDDHPEGCAALNAFLDGDLVASCTPSNPACVAEPGVLKIDTEIPSDGRGYGRKLLTLKGMDRAASGRRTESSMTFMLESGDGWRRVATVPGSIIDANEKFVLYRKYADLLYVPSNADTFGLYDRTADTHTELPKEAGKYLGFGRVTGHGAVYTLYDVATGQSENPFDLYEWRDGKLVPLGKGFRFHKDGEYLTWLEAPWRPGNVYLRNLAEGTQNTVTRLSVSSPDSGDQLLDVSPMGDVLYSLVDEPDEYQYQSYHYLYRWRNGELERLLSRTTPRNYVTGGKTDGTLATYYLSIPWTSISGSLYLKTPTESQVLLSENPSHLLVEGWLAFMDHEESPITEPFQIWLRSPAGVQKQVTYFTGDSRIDNLNPNGELTFTSGSNLYLTGFDQDTERRIWSRNGHAIWLSDGWHLWTNGAFFKMTDSSGPKLGDVDDSGQVDVADAVLVLRSIVGAVSLTPEQRTAADVIADSFIDVNDAIKILRVIAGLDPPLPN